MKYMAVERVYGTTNKHATGLQGSEKSEMTVSFIICLIENHAFCFKPVFDFVV